jgi:hypothetical protein
VIDFERNYYGADFRWTGKELLPNTMISAGIALDMMDEDRKGFKTLMQKISMVSKVLYAVMKTILCGILILITSIMAVFTDMAFRYRRTL